jgi:thymidylate kinase
MVTDVESAQQIQVNGRKRGWVVEIVGPAGAGKSTLYRALEKKGTDIVGEPLPPVWDIPYIPFFAKNILSLIPVLTRTLGKGDRNLSRRELAWMAMLNGWPEILKQKVESDSKIILMDQGPVFLMAILYAFGPQSLQSPEVQEWWLKIFKQWMQVLDVVVWLDTSDEVLTTRIRTRDEDHLVKQESDRDVSEFLAKYRQVYDWLIRTISADNPKLRVLRFNTAQNSVDEIVSSVISEINTAE